MKISSFFLVLSFVVSAKGSELKDDLASSDPAVVRSAIDICKEKGTALLPDLRKWAGSEDARLRLSAKRALGAITGQWGSQTDLIWERDFKSAVKKAAKQKKPIMVLQLFGDLDAEFC